MNSMKSKRFISWIFVLLACCAPWMLCADEIGQSTCGKPIRVQGDIKHKKLKRMRRK